MSEGLGNVEYSTPSNSLGAGGAALANNGLSVLGGTTVQLGGPLGAAAAAVLLNNREIPLGGFSLTLSGVGNVVGGTLILKYDAAKTLPSPALIIQDSGGTEIFKLNVIGAAASGSIYMGTGAGSLVSSSGVRNIGIGVNALGNITTQNFNVAIGWGCMSVLATGQLNVGIGLGVMQNITDGSSNTGVGVQSMLNQTSGCQNNTGVGNGTMANTSGGAGSNNNVFVGSLCGFFTGAIPFDTNQNVVLGSQAFRNAATMGNANVCIGYFINSTGQNIGANNILIGANIQQAAAGMTNSTILGHDITVSISNVAVLCRADQNAIIGLTAAGSDLGSKLQVLGSVSFPITTSAVSLTLDATHHTVILTAGGLVVTLPTAASSTGRIYAIVNEAAASTTSINYQNFAAAAVNTIAANAALWLQSNGVNWFRIA